MGARGLDIPDMKQVVQLDIPQNPSMHFLSGENSQVAKSRAAFVYFTLVEVTCPNCLRSCKVCENILVLFCIIYTLLVCLFSR